MGNACKKNVPEQVKESAPPKAPEPVDDREDEELRRLQELNERLRKQKADLEAELARWREAQRAKMAQIQQEMLEVEEETEKLLGGVDDVTKANLRERAMNELLVECADGDQKDLQLLRDRSEFLHKEMKRMEKEKRRLDSVKGESLGEGGTLDELIQKMTEGRDIDVDSEGDNEAAEQERRLSMIADYYRTYKRPQNCGDMMGQTRVDCAECSSQTVRNIKALFHDIRTGDNSWYKERPIRGVLCSSLQCGENPHDRWNCDLCALLDVTDAPLLI